MKDTTITPVALICPKCWNVYPAEIIKEIDLDDPQGYVTETIRARRDKVHIAHNRMVSAGSFYAMCRPCTMDLPGEEHARLFTVDEKLGPIIAKMNKLGYPTQYSCQGHVIIGRRPDGTIKEVSYSRPYILTPSCHYRANVALYENAVAFIKKTYQDCESPIEVEPSVLRHLFSERGLIKLEPSEIKFHKNFRLTFQLTDDITGYITASIPDNPEYYNSNQNLVEDTTDFITYPRHEKYQQVFIDFMTKFVDQLPDRSGID